VKKNPKRTEWITNNRTHGEARKEC
jgi:hypothetical protein